MGRIRAVRLFRMRECSGGLAFGLDRCDSRPREIAGLQIQFRPLDGRLCRIEIRRRASLGAGDARSGDRLPRIAHFLNWRAYACREAGNDGEYGNGAQHKRCDTSNSGWSRQTGCNYTTYIARPTVARNAALRFRRSRNESIARSRET
jgi:hypothetical protein